MGFMEKHKVISQPSLALIGPYPPPYGGVSVHMKRLHQRLGSLNIPARVYCQPLQKNCHQAGIFPTSIKFSWKTWLPIYGWRCSASIIHFHDGWYWSPAALAMLFWGRKVVFTFHNQEVGGAKWQDASLFEQLISKWLFRHPRVWWVAVSQEVERQLIQKGVPKSRISVIPAYIPPLSGSAQDLPKYVYDFLRVHSPVVSTYAWKLTLDAQGVDVYGFDLCVEMIQSLKEKFPGIGLVISLPQIANPKYFRKLNESIMDYGIQGQVLFVTDPLDDIYKLWQASDVFVRATNTDGDALTVREALSAGVPVVASNVSLRPANTVLFKSRDASALSVAVRQVLENHISYVQSLQGKKIEDNFPALLELYQTISKSHNQLSRA